MNWECHCSSGLELLSDNEHLSSSEYIVCGNECRDVKRIWCWKTPILCRFNLQRNLCQMKHESISLCVCVLFTSPKSYNSINSVQETLHVLKGEHIIPKVQCIPLKLSSAKNNVLCIYETKQYYYIQKPITGRLDHASLTRLVCD